MSSATDVPIISRGIMSSVGTGIKNAAVWCGHAIKVLFTDYLFPAIQKIWPYIKATLVYVWEFLKTAQGIGTLGFIAGVGVGSAILAYACSDSAEKNKDIITRIFLHIFAATAFAMAGASLTAGIILGIV